jgi:hypothetical protein
MSSKARAVISWIPASRGGRKNIPSPVVGYSAPARFASDPDQKLGSWSLRILTGRKLKGNKVIDAKVGFLAEDAPENLLQPRERFELMEGSRVVAKGVILPPSIRPPARISGFEEVLLG